MSRRTDIQTLTPAAAHASLPAQKSFCQSTLVLHMLMSAREFNATRHALFRLLRELSYERRAEPFRLKSGAMSHEYVDCRQTSLTGEGARCIGQLFAHIITMHAPDVVGIGGLTLGADPLVMATIMAGAMMPSRLTNGFLVRKDAKDHGKKDLVVGGKRLKPGSAVAVCDDVITSGGSMIEGVDGAESRGYDVRVALALVDRQEQDGLATIRQRAPRTYALFTLADLSSGRLAPFDP